MGAGIVPISGPVGATFVEPAHPRPDRIRRRGGRLPFESESEELEALLERSVGGRSVAFWGAGDPGASCDWANFALVAIRRCTRSQAVRRSSCRHRVPGGVGPKERPSEWIRGPPSS